MQLSDLNIEKELGGGQSGTIFAVTKLGNSEQKFAYKRYEQPKKTDFSSLIKQVESGQNLYKENSLLFGSMTWPLEIVFIKDKPQGFLMNLATDDYFVTRKTGSENEKVLLSLKHLLSPYLAAQKSFLPSVKFEYRVELAKNLLRVFSFLHLHSWVIGDVSGANILWNINKKDVLVIDCDSFRKLGTSTSIDQGFTPNFEVRDEIPHLRIPLQSSFDSDNFKIGLIIIGLLTSILPDSKTPKINPNILQTLARVSKRSGNDFLKNEIEGFWERMFIKGSRPLVYEWEELVNRVEI